MPMGDFWCLRVPTGYCGCLTMANGGTHSCLRMPIGI